MGSIARGSVFVTVGTTSFDSLVRTIDSEAFVQSLAALGYSSMRVQVGRGEYVPRHFNEVAAEFCGVQCDYYRFKPTLRNDMEQAGLIISHAGAGSIIEALRFAKPLVVVVNDELMDNHQVELAEAMERERYLVSSTCNTLQSALLGANFSERAALPPPRAAAFSNLVDAEVGFIDRRS